MSEPITKEGLAEHLLRQRFGVNSYRRDIDMYVCEGAAIVKAFNALQSAEKERDALKAEVGRLRAALKPFEMLARLYDGVRYADDSYIGGGCTHGMLRRARAALAGDPE